MKTLMITSLILATMFLGSCRVYADYGFDSSTKSDYGLVPASNHSDYTTITAVASPGGAAPYYYNGYYYYNGLNYDSALYYPLYLNGAATPVFLPRNNNTGVVNPNPAPFSNNVINRNSFGNDVINNNGFDNNVINGNSFNNNVINNGR